MRSPTARAWFTSPTGIAADAAPPAPELPARAPVPEPDAACTGPGWAVPAGAVVDSDVASVLDVCDDDLRVALVSFFGFEHAAAISNSTAKTPTHRTRRAFMVPPSTRTAVTPVTGH